ncbi:hypothetical protein MACK_003941 [Theileria orientalis]|uniref:Uncharacterized protein n=1 Tax=Theileria orientalis TaxID=68886 RepID=A0A976SJP7_THEOR|nr:hypothetical protein MACK_003941 [Theileria orientalis]
MKHEPLTSIRFKDGFTSSTYLPDHILTSSITGSIHKWNLESGNPIAIFDTKHNSNYNSLILQEQDAISLFDLNDNLVYDVAKIDPGCFARVSLFSGGSSNLPLVISPFGLNFVKIFDLRLNQGTYALIHYLLGSFTSNAIAEIPPFRIEHPIKSEVGMLHSCSPFHSLGEFCIVTTYESGSIALYDIRKPTSPIVPVYIMDSLEPIPSLSVWNNVLFIGDTVGGIWMFYASQDKGVVFLKKSNVAMDSIKLPGISCLDISHDGSVLVAGCWDRCVRVLETKTLDLKFILDNHCSSIVDVSFSGDSNTFCTCSSDGNVNIWDLFSHLS